MHLTLNNLQWLISNKTKTNQYFNKKCFTHSNNFKSLSLLYKKIICMLGNCANFLKENQK